MKKLITTIFPLLCLFSTPILRGQPTISPAAKNEVIKPKEAIPVMTFEKKFYDFGTIKSGEITEVHVFSFTNTGNAPLDIDQITGCDCSEFDWTRTTVGVGEKGFVSVKFNSKKAEPEEHKMKLDKYIDIILKQVHPANGYSLGESLKFNVFIAD
jgi:hypothetical protein